MPSFAKLGKRNFLPNTTGNYTHSGVHPIKIKQTSGLQIQKFKELGDWKLQKDIFRKITKQTGLAELDLFALRTSHQLPKYFNWKPDPYRLAVDALAQSREQHQLLYAFSHSA